MSGSREDIRCLVDDGVFETACMQCPWGCGVEVHVEEGRIRRIAGDDDHPFSKGVVCPKGLAAPEVMSHPDRITRPMHRTAGGCETIDWDTAYDILAEKLGESRRSMGPGLWR